VPREKDPAKRRELIKGAIKYYQKAVKIWPAYPDALNTLGTIYFNIGDYRQALEVYMRNTKLNPDYTVSLGNVASCYHKMGNIPAAKIYYKKALKVDTLSPVLYLNFADVYISENKPDSAIYLYNLAKKRKINDPEINEGLKKLTTTP